MTNFELMYRILAAIYPVGQRFRLQDGVYPLFCKIPEPSQRQKLQELRDAGFLVFVDNKGTYARI